MAGGRKIFWFGLGFLAASGVVVVLAPHGARAQSRIDTTITSPARPAVDARREPLIRTPRQVQDTDPFSRPRTSARNDTGFDPETDQPLDGAPSGGLPSARRIRQDGDLLPIIPPAPVDGTIIVGEPVGPLDGGDPILQDNRPAADTAAFDSPPAGFDPGAFSIELSPRLDRRPAQLFRFQPYQQIGTPLGSFVLFSQVETGLSATDNVFESADTKKSDIALDISPTLRLISDWSVHAVEFSATGLASFHHEFSSEDDRDYTLEARARLDMTRLSSIEALVSHAVTQESRGTLNSTSAAGRERTDIVTDTAAATVNHRFNRLALQLRGSLIVYDYGPSEVNTTSPPAAAVIIDVDDRDYTARDVALRASWEFNPELTVFAEAALNDRRYDMDQGGVRRDSVGDRWRLGVSFGNSGEIIRGEASFGYARQKPNSNQLDEIKGFVADANLAWRANALTSVLLTARSDIDETTIAGSGGGLTHSVGLALRHAFRLNLIGTAGLSYYMADYQGSDQSENTLTASLGLEYTLNRHIILFGDYDHIRYDSTEAGSDYDVDEIRIGVRLRK